MGTFGELFPGRKLGQEAKDEKSTGEGGPLIPELDLDSGVVVVQKPEPGDESAEN